MAIDPNIYSKNSFRFAIAEEATFGTKETDQTLFNELYITEVPQIDWGGIIRDENKRSDGKRVLSHTDVYQTTAGGTYTCSVSGILTDITADLLLYGVMQDLTGTTPGEADTTPYLKTFEWDDATDGDNSGVPYKFFTLNGYNPDTSENWELKSCVLQNLTINADPGTNGGRASFTATFFTGFPPTITSVTVVPTSWTACGANFYSFQSLVTKTVTAKDVVLNSASFTFENGVIRGGHDSSGDPEYYFFPQFDITGELSVKLDDNSAPEIDKWVTNPMGGTAESAIVIQWNDGSADGTLGFTVNAIYTGHSYDFGNESGVFVSLPFKGVDDGSTEAIVVAIANATDRAW